MDSTSEVLEACIHSPNSTLDNDANITKDITSDEYNTLKNDTELKTTDELIIKPLENILTVDTDTIQLSEEPQINNIKETSSTRIENNNSKIDSSLGSDNENNSSSGNTTSLLGKASDEEKKLVEVTKVDEHEMPTETESDEDGTECLKENTTDDEKCIPESYKSEHVQINSPKEEDPIEKSKAEAKLFSENLKIDVKSEIDLPKNEDPIEKSKAEAKLFSENLKIDVKSEIDLPKNEDPLEKSMAQAKLIFENEQIAVKSEINSPKNEDPMEKSMAQAKLIFENEKIAVKSEINSPKNEDPMDESKAEAKEIFENEKIAVKSEIHSPKNENDYNKQIKHIISDIDVSIRAQMEIAKLKAEEQKLIDKQNELTQYIQQQQQLAQELSLQNQVKIKKLQQMPVLEAEKQPKLLECNSNTLYKDQINPSKTVDLRKIFTPATDTKEILPKNRKLYASSAFYSPTLHPTVEDQVELARRISHSLSDISNQTSKGQSMYVNRKKRSLKWVHEGSAQEKQILGDEKDTLKENSISSTELTQLEKIPLKLIMNPSGKVRDYDSLKELINIETGLLSPDNCAELITALQLHQGRGAELFAKRRKKANNWVIDETNAETQCLPSGITDYQQHQLRPATSPNILPAYSDAAKHRVLLNIHQNQVIKKYSKPGLKFVTSPWEAALQTGSASSAFLEPCKNETTTTPYYSENGAKDLTDNIQRTQHDNLVFNQETEKKSEIASSLSSHSINVPSNTQRNLAYIPNVAQGWGGRNVKLPKDKEEETCAEEESLNVWELIQTFEKRSLVEFSQLKSKKEGLFIPKEISLSSYAPPPEIYQNQHKFEPVPILNIYSFEDPNTHNTRSAFPLNETNGSTNSYQKGPKEVKITSQVTFSPSQLSSDKIARFEHVDKSSQKNSIQQYLTARPKTNVRNASPTPFGVAFNKSATRSPNSISSFGTTLSHPSTTPSTRSGQFYNSKASSLLHQGPTSKAHAHGWDAKNSQEDYWCSPQQHENLPYTDF
ncbi:uncharacterized protein Dana_GF21686, isoform B [Drosophila ananassae]|uniref:Uncharacterized protein, isoform B n=1 Tax=Drosophila ananassae TaxID=7217 RepID=A0A0P8Y656_DROAN|nr:uncharacterized protein LOC6504358 isoform X5 [Drosophila ananassae]KPU74675.1 uncharacterized protein Dana_GF21686, isoform B [Drosophila ananassae]